MVSSLAVDPKQTIRPPLRSRHALRRPAHKPRVGLRRGGRGGRLPARVTGSRCASSRSMPSTTPSSPRPTDWWSRAATVRSRASPRRPPAPDSASRSSPPAPRTTWRASSRSRSTSEEACELAAKGTRVRRLDVGRMGDRPFLNMASTGLSPAAAEHADGLKEQLGPLAYAVGGARAGLEAEPVRLHGALRRRRDPRRRRLGRCPSPALAHSAAARQSRPSSSTDSSTSS